MDIARFLKEQFTPRELTVDVPELAEWFGDEPAQWTVRSLTAREIGQIRAAVNVILQERANALLATTQDGTGVLDQAREVLEFYGKEVPVETTRRIELLVAGSVKPDISQSRMVAVKLSEAFPAIFHRLTDEIAKLIDKGAEPGKRKASGETAPPEG